MTTWADLATAALLGTGRRPVDASALPVAVGRAHADVATGRTAGAAGATADDATDLLDLAALAAVYRRGGVRPATARSLPAAAPADELPEVGPAAAARLVTVLARSDAELLELWLVTAADRGLRPPDRLLPALLDQAAREPAVATALAVAAGPRGRWLAAHRRHWAAALEVAGAVADDSLPDDAWTAGTPQQRLAWLRRLREHDPRAARDLLEAGWAGESPVERPQLLAVLAAGLGHGDEPFLERCLGDRRGEVRRVAAGLLARLPGSAFSGRAAGRARAVVRGERHLLRRRLVVVPPGHRDEGMARDQVPVPPKGGDAARGGPGAWYVRHLVGAAPLHTWVPALGATPADVAGSEVADGWYGVLWCGWAEAAARERDGGWAHALLTRPPAGSAGQQAWEPQLAAGLLDLLPVDRRADVAARWLAEGLPFAAEALAAVPAPWPDRLARVVVERLTTGRPNHETYPLLATAARRLSAGWAPALAAAGARSADPALRRRYDDAAELVLFRSALLEEIR